MEDLIAETLADDIEGVGINLALYVYISGVDPETADSAVEQVLSAYKDCVRVLGRDLHGGGQELDASKSAGLVKSTACCNNTAVSLGVVEEERNDATLRTVVPTRRLRAYPGIHGRRGDTPARFQ
jgi:hypothetical protein